MNQQQSQFSDSQTFEKVWKLFKETDKKFKETDKKFKDTDILFKETDKKISKLLKAIGDINSSWKRLTEGFLTESGLKAFKDRGIKVEKYYANSEIPNICEYDLVFINKTDLVVMECEIYVKRTKSVDEVVRKLKLFRKYFPEYSKFTIFGAIGSFKFGTGIYEYAAKNGLFVVKGGENIEVEILNPKSFKPRKF